MSASCTLRMAGRLVGLCLLLSALAACQRADVRHWPTGALRSEGRRARISGLEEGLWTYYYPNGQRREEGRYEAGRRVGGGLDTDLCTSRREGRGGRCDERGRAAARERGLEVRAGAVGAESSSSTHSSSMGGMKCSRSSAAKRIRRRARPGTRPVSEASIV